MKMKTTNFKIGALASMILMFCFMMFTIGVRAQSNVPGERVEQTLKILGADDKTTDYQLRNFTVPDGVYLIDIECWGAGASGSYMPAPGAFQDPVAGVGGGGGAYAKKSGISVYPGQVIKCYIGRGGVGDGTSHSNGGNTYVVVGEDVVVKAAGAAAVPNSNKYVIPLGGQVGDCIGDMVYKGGNGGKGCDGEWCGSGGGGGAAGRTGDGNKGGDGQSGMISGKGGTGGNPGSGYPFPYLGKGGNGVVSHVGGTSGNDGADYGAGGSGGATSTIFSADAGKGGNGVIIISYIDCAASAGTIDTYVSDCNVELVNVTSASGVSGEYLWQYSSDNSNWTNIPSSNSANHTPTATGFYRRAYVTTCGNTVYTASEEVLTASTVQPGSVLWNGHPGIESVDTCKNVPLSFSFSPNGCDSTEVYWVEKAEGAASWTNMSYSQELTVNNASFTKNHYYAYYVLLPGDCKVYSNNVFKVKVTDGVILRQDFSIDTLPVSIVMDYGDADTVPFISQPDFSPSAGVLLTNNKSANNNGDLLGRVGPGEYHITWTLTDACTSKDYVIRYFVTYPECGGVYEVHDYDGNLYHTVRVGSECWLKENLKSQHYSDGDTIVGNFVYRSNEFPNEALNLSVYGRLYTWYGAVGIPEGLHDVQLPINEYGHVQGACPYGWYIPTADQYASLATIDSKDLRSTNLWIDGLGTDLSGMTLLPGGYRSDVSGRFENMLGNAYFWSAEKVSPTSSMAFWVDCHCYKMTQEAFTHENAMSLRCIKEKDGDLVYVNTLSVDDIQKTSAHFYGEIGPSFPEMTVRGFCYGTNPNPTISDGVSSIVSDTTSTTGAYDKVVDNLVTGSTYYVRAFATNGSGVLYGNLLVFQTLYVMDTITFDPNGAQGSMDDQYIIRDIPTSLSPLGYTWPLSVFRGWGYNTAGPVVYTDEQEITTNGNRTLHALWYHPIHQVSVVDTCDFYTWKDGRTYYASIDTIFTHLDSHGCTQVDTLHLTINPSYVFTVDTAVNNLPYTWHGVTFTAAGTKDALLSTVKGCDSIYHMTLYFNEPYTITFNKNDSRATGTMLPQKINQGSSAFLKANVFTNVEALKFYGWNTKADGTGTAYHNQQEILPTGDMTLYAQWKTWCSVASIGPNETGFGTAVLTVKDHQDNVYNVVEIGGKCWLKENMRATTSPSTGNNIMLSTMVMNNQSKAACYYMNDFEQYGKKYGVMYNWCAMMDVYSGSNEVALGRVTKNYSGSVTLDNHRGICPEGWHVPTVAEWGGMASSLDITVSAYEIPFDVLLSHGLGKISGGNDWQSYGIPSPYVGYPGNMIYAYRNISGFSALPGGYYVKYNDANPTFQAVTQASHFWAAREDKAEVRCVYYQFPYLFIEREDGTGIHVYKGDASYVRCVRN